MLPRRRVLPQNRFTHMTPTTTTTRHAFATAGAAMLGASLPSAKGAKGAALPAGPQFNVRDFGAKGDGKADDADATQNALDAALAAGGGHVYFPAGQYRLSKGLVIREAQRLDITGDGLTSELRYEADAPALTWSPDAACIMSSVRDLCFSATGTDKSSPTPAIACLGGTERGTHFDHLYIRPDGASLGSGIVVEKVMDTTALNHCTITGVTGVGIRIPRGSEVRIVGGRVISGGTIGNGGTYGRAGTHHGLVARSGSFVMNGTALWHNQGCGIQIEGDKVHDFTVTGCRFSNNGTAAALGGVSGSLMGNTLLDNTIAFVGSEKVRNLQETNLILQPSADAAKATK